MNLMSRKQARLLEVYHSLFNTPEGKEILADLASRYNAFSPTFDPHSERVSAFNEGARNVVLDLFKRARTSPEEVLAKLEQMESNDGSTSY
jgi:hypothetical protein